MEHNLASLFSSWAVPTWLTGPIILLRGSYFVDLIDVIVDDCVASELLFLQPVLFEYHLLLCNSLF